MRLKFSNYFPVFASSGFIIVVIVIFFIALGFPSSGVKHFDEVKTNKAEPDTELSLTPSPGNRSVAIPNWVSEGFPHNAPPGARVDVVFTYRTENRLVSEVIVQNARVLRYDRGVPILEVLPEDVLAIEAAQQGGGLLSLALRAH